VSAVQLRAGSIRTSWVFVENLQVSFSCEIFFSLLHYGEVESLRATALKMVNSVSLCNLLVNFGTRGRFCKNCLFGDTNNPVGFDDYDPVCFIAHK